MRLLRMSVVAAAAVAMSASVAVAGQAGSGLNQAAGVDKAAAIYDFQQANPRAKFMETGDRITTIYGPAFGFGDSAEETAEQFRLDYAEMFGVESAELDPRGPLADERHTQDVMPDRENGGFKFTLVYYTQYESGFPVFRSDVRLLVRNEPSHPLVLVSSSLQDLGAFSVATVAQFDFDLSEQSALEAVPGLINFSEPRQVIWAGVDNIVADPAVALEFIADNGLPATADYAKWLFVTEATTGKILYRENQILNENVLGNVSGMASQDVGADFCVEEAVEAMPYARVNIVGGNTVFADANGDFEIPNGGNSPVTVESPIRGEFFRVENQGGANTILSTNVTPPGPANFVHNQANSSEFQRAEVNGYVEANVVRDAILVANPNYPTIGTQTNYLVNVNINSSCNAFYDGGSINFFRSGGGCSNTANTDIVHHEYGHHLVATGGSGQGAYGEGTGDVLGVILTDQPITGLGFFLGNCVSGIRNADNNCQRQDPGCSSCGNQIHACGQLYSGCVWDTRNELMVTEPDTYSLILMDLAVNSVLVHNGSSIRPDITVAWLALDDDDGNPNNGTPHRTEICTGFGAHNMDCPELPLLAFVYPDGRPDTGDPIQNTVFPVEIQSISAELDESSPMQHVSINGGPFQSTLLEQIGDALYNVSLPAAECFAIIDWYLSAATTDKIDVFDPSDAPNSTYDVIVVTSSTVIVEEDFENPVGYTVSGNANTGQWEVGVPVRCNRGDPPADFDGSGSCYLTDNDPNDCNSDVDGGSTILTSPLLDMSGPGDPVLSYARWYSNDIGGDPENDIFVVDISNDGGKNWVNLETVGPSGPEVRGGWIFKSFRVSETIEPTASMQVRWNASDLSGGSVVEAGLDALSVVILDCDDSSVILLPEGLEIIRGRQIGGDLADLFGSDDSRMRFHPGLTQNPDEPPVWLELTGTSVTDAPSELRFVLESRVSTPGVTQTISLFNYDTQDFEEVDVSVPTNTDGVAEVVIDVNPARFINSETLEVKAELRWNPPPLVLMFPWEVGIDQAIWRVVP